MYYKLLGGISVVALVVASFYWVNVDKDEWAILSQQLKVSHIIYNPDKALPEFSLLDYDNQAFNNTHLKGDWSLVLFIYTHCPDVCPTELMDMASLKRLIEADKTVKMPKVVAITFDPLRDTPEVLKTYISYFDKDFIGVSGEQAQIDRLIKPFGAYYERVIVAENGKQTIFKASEKLPENALKEGYIVNHTAWVYLLNPKGQIFAGFPSPHKPKEMMQDIKLIREYF